MDTSLAHLLAFVKAPADSCWYENHKFLPL